MPVSANAKLMVTAIDRIQALRAGFETEAEQGAVDLCLAELEKIQRGEAREHPCRVCGTAVSVSKRYCSSECQASAVQQRKAQRNTMPQCCARRQSALQWAKENYRVLAQKVSYKVPLGLAPNSHQHELLARAREELEQAEENWTTHQAATSLHENTEPKETSP